VRRGQGLGLIRSEHGGEGPAVAGGRALSRLACGSGEWRGDATDGKARNVQLPNPTGPGGKWAVSCLK
jgi:hypothetical protein